MEDLITSTPDIGQLKFKAGTRADFETLPEIEEGTIYFCTDDEKYYAQTENGLTEINFDVANKGFEMNLYDLNKNVISQMDPMNYSEITMKMGLMTEFNHNAANIHYMLLCRDYNYYTIFEYDSMKSFPDFASAVCTIISELGQVYSIEPTESNDALEIWICPEGRSEAYAFYLFPYDAGVVYYG